MLAFLSRLVFQKADIVLLPHRQTEYNGCTGSTLSNSLSHFEISTFSWPYFDHLPRLISTSSDVTERNIVEIFFYDSIDEQNFRFIFCNIN